MSKQKETTIIKGGEATKLLNISPQAFCSLVKRKRLKATKIRKHYELTHDDILDYVNLRLDELRKESHELESLILILK
jgi:hypothetical protein